MYSNSFNDSFLVQLSNIYAWYILIIGQLPKEDRNEVLNKMKELKFLLKYTNNARGKFVKIFSMLLGFKITYTIYNIVKKVYYIKNSKEKKFDE